MRRLATVALAAAGIALAVPAMADNGGWGRHHGHHWNHGGGYVYYNSGGYYPGYYYPQPYYYQPPPVYYYPAPVYAAPPPPPVYYYPAPVYQGPQFSIVVPLDFDWREAMTGPAGSPHNHSPERRRLLRWFGAVSLILPATLAACANSTPPRHYQRPPSHITGKDHRN